MAQIPTVTMWDREGRKVIVNAGDAATQDEFQELGYELESTIREGLPEGTDDMAMEDIIAEMAKGTLKPATPPEITPKEETPVKAGGQGEGALPTEEMSPEGKEALDQASGQAEPSPEEAREETTAKDSKTKEPRKGGPKKK